MMNGRGPAAGAVAEVQDLEFRYRSLLAAQRILDEQAAPSSAGSGLHRERLRRLCHYIRNAIAAVEHRLDELGVGPPSGDRARPPARRRAQPAAVER